jgi:hypothetical protein
MEFYGKVLQLFKISIVVSPPKVKQKPLCQFGPLLLLLLLQ